MNNYIVSDAAAVNPNGNGIKTLLVYSLNTFSLKEMQLLVVVLKVYLKILLISLPKNTPDFPILCNWIFDDFVLADELFANALQSLETCIS